MSMRPPVRRVLAVDAGSRRLKLLLAESDFGRFRILKEEMIDLEEEGLVSAEELRAHLQEALTNWGNPPVALVLPQHLSISQTLDLPLVPENEVADLIADETVKLSGISESPIVYDFVPVGTVRTNRQQFWVTISQEGEIRARIESLGIAREDLCDVTTTANALIAAYRSVAPRSHKAVLVHLGAQTTVLVVTLAGEGAFAASFQMGGDFFTRALARLKNCSEESAEAMKRTRNLLTGPEAWPEFAAVVDGWAAELKRQLAEWFQQNPEAVSESREFELIATGGGFDQPGLLEYLKTKVNLALRPWPRFSQPEAVAPNKGFAVAFGAALQALGYSAQPVSLLPGDYRASWRKRQSRQRIELASLAIVVLCVVVLAFGTWHKLSLITTKKALLDKVSEGLKNVQFNETLTADLLSEYESLRPVLAREQNTLDTLNTFALLELSRSNRSLFYVLLADQQSYFSSPPAILATNRPVNTNLLSATIESLHGGSSGLKPSFAPLTNAVAARPGLIAELCIPGDAESARLSLGDLVYGLKQPPLFSKVDLLSEDLRRSLADPKVIVPDRHYVLALDFAAADFQQPVRWKKSATNNAARPRRAVRPAWPPTESVEGVTTTP